MTKHMRFSFPQLIVSFLFPFAFFPTEAKAIEFRLFGIGREFEATEMNRELQSQELKEVRNLIGVGGEVTFEPVARLHFGIRGHDSRMHLGDSKGSTLEGDSNFALLKMNTIGLVARWTIAEGSPLRFDLFGGAGIAQGILKTRKLGVEYEQGIGIDASRPMQFAGATLSLGGPMFYFIIEGGREWVRLNDIRGENGTPAPIRTLNLDGSFVSIGFSMAVDFSDLKVARKK